MPSISTLLFFMHLVGFALAVGAATTKLGLLLLSRKDIGFAQLYVRISRPVTRYIITGIAVLTLSGIGWVLTGYPLTGKLIVKLVLVLAVWIMGPVIDNVVEPQFNKCVAEANGAVTDEFLRVHKRYMSVEILATGLFYGIIIVWVLL
jgi:hypothetical protein